MCSLFSTERCCLRRLQSSHARVGKPLFTVGLNDLWLYPHLVWAVRRNRWPGCGRGRMLTTTWSHRWQLGARWGPKVGNCLKKDTTVRLTRGTTPPRHPQHPKKLTVCDWMAKKTYHVKCPNDSQIGLPTQSLTEFNIFAIICSHAAEV